MKIPLLSIVLALLHLSTTTSKRKQRSHHNPLRHFPLVANEDDSEQVLMPAPEWRFNDSCNVAGYREVIEREGCQPRYIKNRYCFGQCNSLYIPQMDSTIRHCKACAPVEVSIKTINLKCTINNRWVNNFPLNVTIVRRCECQNVQCFGYDQLK